MAGNGWERHDFPLICQTCLGDNPYVRMLRSTYDAACHICNRPFTVYRWKAGTQGRIKKTEICQNCSKIKHVCQTCLLDIDSDLPVQFRDSFLSAVEADAARPQSELVRQYQSNINEKLALNNKLKDYSRANQLALESLSRSGLEPPNYNRNRSKICTFFVKGECNRGEYCPFRHEMPDFNNPELSKQNIKDRYYGTEDVVAKRLLQKAEEHNGEMHSGQKTVFVCGFDDSKVSEKDLRDRFYQFGLIISFRKVKDVGAFIEYADHEEAKRAIGSLRNNLVINGQFIKVSWASNPKESPMKSSKDGDAKNSVPPIGFFQFTPGKHNYVPQYSSMNSYSMGSSIKGTTYGSSGPSSAHGQKRQNPDSMTHSDNYKEKKKSPVIK